MRDLDIDLDLDPDQAAAAARVARAYRAASFVAYLNGAGMLAVVCDLETDERDGFLLVDGVWIEFEPNPADWPDWPDLATRR